MSEKLTLAQKLVEVYKKVDHIEKRGINKAQSYKYVKASDLAHAIRNALAELGVYAQVEFSCLRTYLVERGLDDNGRQKPPMQAVDVRCDMSLFDTETETSGRAYHAVGLGSGTDMGDKAIFKAQTGALKYALRNAFLVPDDTDPENEGENVESEKSESKKSGSGKHYESGKAPAGTDPNLIDLPKKSTKAASVPKAEIPSESLKQDVAKPGETGSPAAVPASSGIIAQGETDTLPDSTQLQSLRNRFSLVTKDVSDAGLKASKGMPVGRKVTLYLLNRTGMTDPEKVTYQQWQKFFEECGSYKEDGFKELVTKINAVVETK